jgi:hypothetical protein
MPDKPTPIEIPAIYRLNHERLVYELALKIEPAEDVFARYGYTIEQAAELAANPAFGTMLEAATKEVMEKGLAFQPKIRAIAEDVLPDAYAMIKDPFAPASVRADLIQWSARLAGHEPKKDDKGQTGSGGLVLNITFSGDAPTAPSLVSREPITIEQEA